MAFGEGLGLSKIHVHVHVFIYPDFSLLGIRAIFVRLYYSYSFHARSFSLVKAYGGFSALGPCSGTLLILLPGTFLMLRQS